ncbi:Zinc finger protein [Fasciolopsis buskii]|uniref:Zinc finger protein n=1 Tax=Fasciolopsis buskii TaxID=27845 RepID=A0A8E0VK26_9TREM|nr:Zinc finger protein [Fasciolopsis buski]
MIPFTVLDVNASRALSSYALSIHIAPSAFPGLTCSISFSPQPLLSVADVTRRTITLIKSKKGTGSHSADKSVKTEITTNETDATANVAQASRRMSRARRLPAWYKDYDTDFGAQEEPVLNREQVQAQLPPGIELEDPSAIEKQDVPTEEWNIVVYEDEEDEEEGDAAQDYVPIDGENCDPDLLADTASMLVT